MCVAPRFDLSSKGDLLESAVRVIDDISERNF